MLTFKTLEWDNAFSYLEGNKVNFVEAPLTQIVGKNGHGKSSIASVLEEVLFNKNSKGIKKADVINRNSKQKAYTIKLDFDKDGDEYSIFTKRTSTQVVKLTKNGVDISAHTPTNTYKLIEEILGYDFKTFSQIVYQSSARSLEFLTATDTTRKKFLIDLLSLEKYSKIADVFKELAKDTSEELAGYKSTLNTINSWITKYEKEDLDCKEPEEVPPAPTKQMEELASLNSQILTLERDNKLVIQNNKYKDILDSINVQEYSSVPIATYPDQLATEIASNKAKVDVLKRSKKDHSSKVGITKCPTCNSPIDDSVHREITERVDNEIAGLEVVIKGLNTRLSTQVTEYNLYTAAQLKLAEWEKYYSLFDPSLPATTTKLEELELRIRVLEKEISVVNSNIKQAQKHNENVAAHNSRVKVILSQREDMLSEKAATEKQIVSLEELLSIRQILVKTFSTTGLVAYKIECLVKDLEEITNQYLVGLSDGRFQIAFKVSSSDKLNVIITDNGCDVEITSLSSGELARVNIATLLAIRKIMQAISNSRTNLLILDETIDNLDLEGKERLVEILLEEEYLNTFVISHGFTHPLLQRLSVVKEDGISRIENG